MANLSEAFASGVKYCEAIVASEMGSYRADIEEPDFVLLRLMSGVAAKSRITQSIAHHSSRYGRPWISMISPGLGMVIVTALSRAALSDLIAGSFHA